MATNCSSIPWKTILAKMDWVSLRTGTRCVIDRRQAHKTLLLTFFSRSQIIFHLPPNPNGITVSILTWLTIKTATYQSRFSVRTKKHYLIGNNFTRDLNLLLFLSGSWGGGTMEDYARAPLPYDNKTGSIAWVNSNCGKRKRREERKLWWKYLRNY